MRRTVSAALGVLIFFAAFAAQAQTVLEEPERQAMTDTLQYALEFNQTHQPSDWVNPDTGRAGAVVPTRTFKDTQGLPCREFLTTITIAGRQEQGYGTACRQPDGAWRIVAPESPAQPPPAAARNLYIHTPPPVYYSYPADLYGPHPIFLSFSYVYRSGHHYRGTRYITGPEFRHRHPLTVRDRVYIGPQVHHYYYRHDDRGSRSRYEYRLPGHRWREEYRRDRSDHRFRDDRRFDDRRGRDRGRHEDDPSGRGGHR